MKRIEIIAIGDEVLRGERNESNCAAISRALSRIGLQVQRATVLPDDLEALIAGFREAASRSDVVIATGGLGPTVDDITKEAVIEAFDLEVEYREDIARKIEERYLELGRAMPAGYRDQGRVPRDSSMIENPVGLAAGLRIPLGSCEIFLLPGVPAEMRKMLEESVIPALGSSYRNIEKQRIRTFGLTECEVQDRLSSILPKGILEKMTLVSSQEGVDVYLDEVAEMVDLEKIVISFGIHAYARGDESIAQVVVRLLATKRETVSVAESVTGGLIASNLVSVSGASKVFPEGIVAYSNEAKIERLGVPARVIEEHGAVSEEACAAMAEGERTRAKTTYAIATTGIAGPTGAVPGKPVGLCFVGLATDSATFVRMYRFMGDRDFIRQRAAWSALDMLRLALLGAQDYLAQFSVKSA